MKETKGKTLVRLILTAAALLLMAAPLKAQEEVPNSFVPQAADTSALEGTLPMIAAHDLEEIFFSPQTNDPAARDKAVQMHNDYYRATYPDTGDLTPLVASARYLPLDESRPERFLALADIGGDGQSCVESGCTFYIFELQDGKKWHLALRVLTNKIWIGPSPGAGMPRDIYLKVDAISSMGHPRELVNLWRYKEGEFVHSGQFLAL